ncbi:type II secretion system protein [Bacillus sp. FJAT-27245]|uniref:type II secretion system protein n=1 Tax=Bacillus sp. FJAT-27245 TaxID=1684144 RepID=UPI0006A76387|nr:type II secretion system protein [Bacillus sp. FJAT-27245]
MLQRSRGFFLAEMLLSLTALGIAALFLIPALGFLWEKGERISFEKTARQLMYSELIRTASEGSGPFSRRETIGGYEYKVFVRQDGKGNREVCVSYEHSANGNGTVCGFVE